MSRLSLCPCVDPGLKTRVKRLKIGWENGTLVRRSLLFESTSVTRVTDPSRSLCTESLILSLRLRPTHRHEKKKKKKYPSSPITSTSGSLTGLSLSRPFHDGWAEGQWTKLFRKIPRPPTPSNPSSGPFRTINNSTKSLSGRHVWCYDRKGEKGLSQSYL